MSTTFETRIESYDVQPNDNVRLSALFCLFQKAAGDDLDSLGMTYDTLREHGIVFVLTKMTVQFFDTIHGYDIVKITTRPRTCKGVSFIRDYDLEVGGKRVAYATSSWVLLDINNRRLLRPNALDGICTIPVDMSEIYEIEDRRIKFHAEEMQKTDVRKVYYSQIDRNGHMNNTFYPDIVYDYFPDEYKNSDIGKTISIYYTTEAMRDECLDIYTQSDRDAHEFRFLAKNAETGKDIFAAFIDY